MCIEIPEGRCSVLRGFLFYQYSILSTSTLTKGFCATTSTPFNSLLASAESIVPKSMTLTVGFKVNLCGGGFTGQSQALRLAIARALVKMNAEDKAALRAEGFMTRDPRSVERKKPGQPKARRRFQFSKR